MYPVRSTTIKGAAAEAVSFALSPAKRRPLEMMTVKTAEDVALALGDDGNEQHCPLCNEYFTTKGFVAHAPQCIQARAPRERIWMPPGTSNAIQAYSDNRPTQFGGRFG